MDQQNNNLTDDQLIDQITDKVMAKILAKIAKDLREEDLAEIDKLNQDDKDGQKVKAFLAQKVPNLESIIFNELQDLKKQSSK